MSSIRLPACAVCPIPEERRICRVPDGIAPPGCPSRLAADALEEARAEAEQDANLRLLRQAAHVEAHAYRMTDEGRRPLLTRIEETMLFARRIGAHRLGLAFCAGLAGEARRLSRLLESHGFEVASAVCKAGGVHKGDWGIPLEDRLSDAEHESACHPLGQAAVLAAAGTQLNLAIGLCVGHDALFLRHSRAPVTVLAVKDRVTGHCPLAPLYTQHSYRRHLTGSDDRQPDRLIDEGDHRGG